MWHVQINGLCCDVMRELNRAKKGRRLRCGRDGKEIPEKEEE
jgi:hypothetical protein